MQIFAAANCARALQTIYESVVVIFKCLVLQKWVQFE